jgi:hypothetical protein
MRLRTILPLLALLAALMATPGSADAKSRYKVGFGDQDARIFSDPNFTSLGIKRVRLIVPYDFRREAYQLPQTADWINRAQAAGDEVMIAFNSPRGCYNGGKYSKKKYCKAPTPAKFQKAFQDFRKLFPKVKIFQPWNEINSKSQPTAKNPKRAAQYYNVAKKNCKKCTILAADLLDSSSVFTYVKKMRRYIKGSPKVWGVHNYSDVNRPKQKGKYTKGLAKILPGQIWLTETGGLVKFEKNFPYSTKRANASTKNLFKLADKYSKKLPGFKSKVTRVYPYTFYGETKGERFDAGLVGPLPLGATSSAPRPAYKTFKKLVKSRSK